jgi:ABC-2 type transport system permease protein
VAEPASVIHDIGYQRYTGPRLGRRYAARSLYEHGVRTAFGLGRSGKAKVFPWLVVGIVFLVAIVAVVIRSQSDRAVITYLQFADDVAIPVLLFFAVVAPELVSRDLRAGVLPLYFSRPLHRRDYALAKLGAMLTAAWLLLAGPELLMLLGGLFSQQHGLSGAWHEITDFLGGLGYAAIYAVVFGSIAILVASLASRRAVAAAAIVAVYLVTSPVVGVLEAIGGRTLKQLAPILNPIALVEGLKAYVFRSHSMDIGNFGPVYLAVAVLLVAACVSLLLARYRKVAQ